MENTLNTHSLSIFQYEMNFTKDNSTSCSLFNKQYIMIFFYS